MNKTQPLNKVSTNLDMPRFAMIGCGAIAEKYYLPALSQNPGIMQNLILIDRDLARVEKLAAKYKVSTFTDDYRKVLREIKGAIIATPTHTHYPIAKECLEEGIPVLCEKPLAESASRARELVEQADKKGVALAVNYLQRLVPSFAKVKEIIENKTFGDLLRIQYYVGEEFKWPTVSGFYFNAPLSSRGVLRDRGAHVMDHICWWLGEKPELVASQNDSFGGSEATAMVQFVHGRCRGEVRLCCLVDYPCKFKLLFEKGSIEGDVYDYLNLVVKNKSGVAQYMTIKSTEKTKSDIANKIVTNFIDVVRNGERPLIAGHEVLKSIEFIDECYSAVTRFDMPWNEVMEAQNG